MQKSFRQQAEEELQTLLAKRSEFRKLAIQYEESAKAMDKQINRLTGFLSDYGQDISDPHESVPQTNGNGNGHRKHGVLECVVKFLECFPEEFVPATVIKAEIREKGFNPNSVPSIVARLFSEGKAEKKELPGRLVGYRLKARV